jgi:hypothetical protein
MNPSPLAVQLCEALRVLSGFPGQASSGSGSLSQSGSMNNKKPPTAIAIPIPTPKFWTNCLALRGRLKSHLPGLVDRFHRSLGIRNPDATKLHCPAGCIMPRGFG